MFCPKLSLPVSYLSLFYQCIFTQTFSVRLYFAVGFCASFRFVCRCRTDEYWRVFAFCRQISLHVCMCASHSDPRLVKLLCCVHMFDWFRMRLSDDTNVFTVYTYSLPLCTSTVCVVPSVYTMTLIYILVCVIVSSFHCCPEERVFITWNGFFNWVTIRNQFPRWYYPLSWKQFLFTPGIGFYVPRIASFLLLDLYSRGNHSFICCNLVSKQFFTV